ncbi:hypothetical protein KJ762_13870 [bacterium]|nr:hypothetical protein [bacterium]MBU1065126.1 hypothetical protein [bacterium]MBU1635577.1 hypothetical protein [bacterium]MBU1874030.1 hypothetical protein [bacterium]
MRNLYIFPIIHTDIELGSYGPVYRKYFIRKNGLAAWKRKWATVKHLWDCIETTILKMNLDYQKLRIYQDSLSVEMSADVTLNEMTARGSRNYLVIDSLLKKGAQIMGTENSVYLLEQYSRLQLGSETSIDNDEELLKKRDAFIAHRIESTLRDDETGLLFIGADHDVSQFFSLDIKTSIVNCLSP